jgi:hypothetical protein
LLARIYARYGRTYRGVDGLISFHVGILASSVVDLSEGNAWNAVGDQAYNVLLVFIEKSTLE